MFGKTILKTLTATAVAAASLTVAAPQKASAGVDPFVGEMAIYPYSFCPRGWLRADGQLLPIAQYNALFSLYGTMFGGDGRTTFGLPDMRGRVPMGVGTGPGLTPRQMGQKFGEERHTLSVAEIPPHSHTVNSVAAGGDKGGPNSDFLAAPGAADGSTKYNDMRMYHDGNPNATMDPRMISNTGGGQAHNNIQPVQVLQFCISTDGIYPPRD